MNKTWMELNAQNASAKSEPSWKEELQEYMDGVASNRGLEYFISTQIIEKLVNDIVDRIPHTHLTDGNYHRDLKKEIKSEWL